MITLGWLVWIRPPSVIEDLRSGPGWESFYVPVVIVLAVMLVLELRRLVERGRGQVPATQPR